MFLPKVLAIIPARSDSKGIPNKNIANLCGKPLIAYTIESALKSKYLDRIICSTNCEKIAAVACKWGGEAPFLRPNKLAEDHILDEPVIKHALKWLVEHENYYPKIVLNLRPTSPFRTAEDIDNVIEKIISTNCDSVRTMSPVEHFHPYWMYTVKGDSAFPFIKGLDPSHSRQRQSLPSVFRLNGIADAMQTENILKKGTLFGNDIRVVIIPPERAINIDSPLDLEFAEFLLQRKVVKKFI